MTNNDPLSTSSIAVASGLIPNELAQNGQIAIDYSFDDDNLLKKNWDSKANKASAVVIHGRRVANYLSCGKGD